MRRYAMSADGIEGLRVFKAEHGLMSVLLDAITVKLVLRQAERNIRRKAVQSGNRRVRKKIVQSSLKAGDIIPARKYPRDLRECVWLVQYRIGIDFDEQIEAVASRIPFAEEDPVCLKLGLILDNEVFDYDALLPCNRGAAQRKLGLTTSQGADKNGRGPI